MKKTAITAFVCALIFCAVYTGCNNANGGKPQQKPTDPQTPTDPQKPTESPSGKPAIPEEIAEKAFSEFPADQQAEIESLYGYYWAKDGTRSECPAIDAERLALYTTNPVMSMGFTNLRWSRVSSSTWVCFSYAEGDLGYEEKRIIFTFVKDGNGTVKVWDKIMRMNAEYGPYIKGKEPEKFVEGGKMYYRYDASSFKLCEPTLK